MVDQGQLVSLFAFEIPAAPNLPPAPAFWAVPANENITWPILLAEKPKRRELFQNKVSLHLFTSKEHFFGCSGCYGTMFELHTLTRFVRMVLARRFY